RVFEHGMSYVCENAVGPGKHCDFRSGKIILQQEVAPAQMRKLLAEGRTDLLTDFVSSRTRRKFKAYLVLEPGGKVGLAFEPRPAKKTVAKAAPEASSAARKTSTRTASASAGTASEPGADVSASVAKTAEGKEYTRAAASSGAKKTAKKAAKKV